MSQSIEAINCLGCSLCHVKDLPPPFLLGYKRVWEIKHRWAISGFTKIPFLYYPMCFVLLPLLTSLVSLLTFPIPMPLPWQVLFMETQLRYLTVLTI